VERLRTPHAGQAEIVPNDGWWQRRYARSAEAARRDAAEWSRLQGDAGAVLVHHPGGRRYRVRSVAPGEPVDHGCLTVLAWFVAGVFVGRTSPTSTDRHWVVVVERKTSWWTRYRRLRRWNTTDGASAGRLRATVVRHLRNGEDDGGIDGWTNWSGRGPSSPRSEPTG
jgi:hypothetical protein